MLASLLALAPFALQGVLAAPSASDPCVKVGGVKWAAPADVRACFSSFPVNETIRSNLVENLGKNFAQFHVSSNYQRLAPPPFSGDVHDNLDLEFKRLAKQKYKSYLDFHQDVQLVIRRLRDGHAGYTNLCYDSVFVSYVPFPLVVLESPLGSIGSIHIAPEASKVAAAEFPDQISYWQGVKGLSDLASFDGATVLLINGLDPWLAVDQNAQVMGSFQSFATRQNAYFSSYTVASNGWTYRMGDFAATALPIRDSVTITVLKKGAILPTTVTVPFRSRFSNGVAFTDGPSFFAQNCLAAASTNGVDLYATAFTEQSDEPEPGRESVFFPPVAPQDRWRAQNTMGSDELLFDIVLPPVLTPSSPTSGSGAMQFYQLDNTTGVLALGSFSGTYSVLNDGLLAGLQDLKARGATKLIVDVTNNGGGYICIAHWLHRIIAGPSAKSEPQAGLDTKFRASPLVRKIVDRIVTANADPSNKLLYNALGWRNDNNTDFPEGYNWVTPGQPTIVNGVPDAFSERIGDECQPFDTPPPTEQLFAPKNIVILNNGRCASSCSLFTIAMNVHYGVKTVVVGGKPGAHQNYCGTVGGQSTSYVTMDSQVKTVGLKSDPLAPPDLIPAVSVGITWRLGYSIKRDPQPEEWQDHPATYSYTPTADTVNKPAAVWAALAKKYLK